MANWLESEFGLAALYGLIAEDLITWSLFAIILAIGKQPTRALSIFVFAIYLLGWIATIAAFVGLFKDRNRWVAIGAVILGICNQAFLSLIPMYVFLNA